MVHLSRTSYHALSKAENYSWKDGLQMPFALQSWKLYLKGSPLTIVTFKVPGQAEDYTFNFDDDTIPENSDTAQWASTGGQVAYFKKIYIYFFNFPCFILFFNV